MEELRRIVSEEKAAVEELKEAEVKVPSLDTCNGPKPVRNCSSCACKNHHRCGYKKDNKEAK